MTRCLWIGALAALVVGCGSAGGTLQDSSWNIENWTYSVDTVFDGAANMPATSTTTTASASNAGTLSFMGGAEVATGNENQLIRNFNQFANRGTSEAAFVTATSMDTLAWDPGGFASETDMILIYAPNDSSWNGAWTVSGGGGDVTLTRGFQTDLSPTQHLVEHHTLHLTR